MHAGRAYQVRLQAPCHDDETGGYHCDWDLTDETGATVISLAAYGEDSVQALILAVIMIGDRLSVEPGGFTWLDLAGSGFLRHRLTEPSVPSFGWDIGTPLQGD